VTPGGHLVEEEVVVVVVVVVEVLTPAGPVPAAEAPLDCLEGTEGLGQAELQAA